MNFLLIENQADITSHSYGEQAIYALDASLRYPVLFRQSHAAHRTVGTMNRRELRELTRDRLADTRVLLRAHRYSAAYYLAGYAVECGLKACIAKQVERHDFPDKKLANDSYTHDLAKLVGIAGLQSRLDAAVTSDKAFELNWRVVRGWSETRRYKSNISRADARKLYGAITERRSGVMTWLRNDW